MQKNIQTLDDYLKPGLKCVSIGLNPSIPSVKAGFYFANPRNRFWSALNGSGLLNMDLSPSVDAMQILLQQYGFGFTDVVKRPTRGAADLKAADFKYWAPRLKSKLGKYQPVVAWFHGKVAYQHYLRYAEAIRRDIEWGEQVERIGQSRVFVTPNTSPANAAYTLQDLITWFRALGDYMKPLLAK